MIVKNIATLSLGMLGATGNFVKIQNASQPTEEIDEKMQLQRSNGVLVSLSRDSLETNGEN